MTPDKFRGGLSAALCFLTAFALLAALPSILSRQRLFYAQKEARCGSPLLLPALSIRSDRYGKGHFGASRHGRRTHEGVDFLAPPGTPVLTVKSGRVLVSATGKSYGKYIQILHPDGLMSCYAHLSSLNVKKGDWVKQKEIIGKSGKTGNANHPSIKAHLHFELRMNQKYLDPFKNNSLYTSRPTN
ncbi:MAG: M23 family metallopeptidase [Candidatus Omnitrophica bacterium]|nr:M23 family metallopeptidase [Candidatus Omnitrophota bacterium]